MTSYQIDATRGSLNGSVSAQWASRPDDQKFLSLADLEAHVGLWADQSHEVGTRPADIDVYAAEGELVIEIEGEAVTPTHYAFGDLCRTASAPAQYMRRLPAPLAAACLTDGLLANSNGIEAYIRRNGQTDLRAITSPQYGRILDVDVVRKVREIAGNGTGDTNWKVPGVIEWGPTTRYNPDVPVSKQTTTLYASDRDVFCFLVDDHHPVEVGKLANGEPDLLFRGFYVSNSEVGARALTIATMYLRGVCQNRNLWGVEGFDEITIRHTAAAEGRFLEEAAPALLTYSNLDSAKLIEGVRAAKSATVATDEEERIEFLARFGFTRKVAIEMIGRAEVEEDKAPSTPWDFAQAITSHARLIGYQDTRLDMERVAKRILDKAAA